MVTCCRNIFCICAPCSFTCFRTRSTACCIFRYFQGMPQFIYFSCGKNVIAYRTICFLYSVSSTSSCCFCPCCWTVIARCSNTFRICTSCPFTCFRTCSTARRIFRYFQRMAKFIYFSCGKNVIAYRTICFLYSVSSTGCRCFCSCCWTVIACCSNTFRICTSCPFTRFRPRNTACCIFCYFQRMSKYRNAFGMRTS